MTRLNSFLLTPIAAPFLGLFLATPADAHLAHLGEVAGHTHWVSVGLAAAAAALVIGFGRGKKAKEADAEAEPEEDAESAEPEGAAS